MHLRTWLVWIAAIVVVTLSTHNPLYLALILLVNQVVSARLAEVNGVPRPTWWWRFGLFVIPISAVFNAVSVHFGDTVLFTIPGNLPLVSGVVTLEAITYGALNGLLITVVISVFSIFNQAIPAYLLVRSTPRAFQSMGVTVGIALTFIPQTLRRFKEVREAQAVRGHHLRTLRDWLPLWLPLLIGGLEQSTQLSEAMVARGFGATQERAASLRTRALFALGLALVLVGWVWRFALSSGATAGTIVMLTGVVMVLLGLWSSGRSVTHTVFRPQSFTARDIFCIAISVLVAVLLLVSLPFISQQSLAYYPYPTVTLPGFEPLLGCLILGWLAPLLVLGKSQQNATQGPQ
ncbi:MAG TPA: energy-coupling factor transporter transmembrane component T [Anaerolineae bacterium]